MKAVPEITEQDRLMVRAMSRKAERGWYIGTEESLLQFAQVRDVPCRTNPELTTRLMLSKDRMHHSVGWWRNAEYEYCWHLSMSAWSKLIVGQAPGDTGSPEDVPAEEERYWAHAFFPQSFGKLWHEPGGTDPRYSAEEKRWFAHVVHLRLFLDPETFEPFIPTGEVYDLTRWIDGLTPAKVDR